MDFILNIDHGIEYFLTVARSDFWARIFLLITDLGKWQIVLILAILTMLALWFWNKRSYILPFAVTVLGSQIFESILKKIFQRPRPLEGVYYEDSFSFPSGHAVVAMAFYGFLMYFICKNVRNNLWRNSLLFFGSAIILLVGFSRLYLGMHFFTDVLGGYVLGAIWLCLGIYLLKSKVAKKLK